MAFDPLDWLTVADSLLPGDEASRRAAIGRYYYAVFIKCRVSLAAEGRLEVRQSRDDHRGVVNALARRRQAAATALMSLARLRESADYDVDITITARHAENGRALAQRVKFMCEPDWQRAST